MLVDASFLLAGRSRGQPRNLSLAVTRPKHASRNPAAHSFRGQCRLSPRGASGRCGRHQHPHRHRGCCHADRADRRADDIPSFTRNWLVRENPGRFPVPFGRFDVIAVGVGALALLCWIVRPTGDITGGALAVARLLHLARLARWAGERTGRERLLLILHVGYAFVPFGFLLNAASAFGWFVQRRDPRLDGGGRGHHDARGDEPRNTGAYRPAVDSVSHHAGDLCCDRRCGPFAGLRGA